MSNDTNRISAANGMLLNNHRIGKRLGSGRTTKRSDAIHDTLETTDSPSNQHQLSPISDQETSDESSVNDSVSPGDVLDISG